MIARRRVIATGCRWQDHREDRAATTPYVDLPDEALAVDPAYPPCTGRCASTVSSDPGASLPSVLLPPELDLRPLDPGDAPALAAAAVRNREHLAPWDPDRDERYYTVAGQQESVRAQLGLVEQGRLDGWVLWLGEHVVGRYALSNISRGVLLSANLGYWVDRDLQGQGLASAMVEHACVRAGRLGLHRVEAGTMIHNHASQAVLRRCGFEQYGTAPRLMYLSGAWHDHHLFQRILHDEPAGGAFL